MAKLSKTDIRYWQERIFFPEYTKNGEKKSTREYAVRLQHLDRRETFQLGTANKAAAGAKARDIYEHLKAHGWDKTLAKFKPSNLHRPLAIATVGDFVSAIRDSHAGNPKTLNDYIRAFRLIVSQAFHIQDKDNSRYDYRARGREEWITRVESIKLSDVTPDRIQRWKVAYLKRKGGNPLRDRTARNSLNSILRQAKSLFSRDRIRFLELPSGFQSPFIGIRPEPRQSMRYSSSFDLATLTMAALAELPDEPLKAFLLSAMAGLRKNEIDKLQWSAFDFERKTLRVNVSEHGTLKSEDSIGDVDLDVELAELFHGYKAKARGPFVIASEQLKPAAKAAGYTRYRADLVLTALVDWLRSKGINGYKPLHTLRKEFGSQICDQFGIFAASRALRHADITITSQHYLDKKHRTSIGLGHLLSASE